MIWYKTICITFLFVRTEPLEEETQMRKQIIFTNQPPRKLFFSVLVPYLLLLAVTISLLVSGYLYCIQQSRQDMEALQISYRNELSATRNQLLQGLRQKRAEFVYGLCSGQVSPAQLEKGVKLYHLTLEDGPVYLIQFGFRKTEKSVFAQNGVVDMNLMLFASCNVTEELLCRERGVVVSHEGQNLCLYQPWSQEEEDSLRKTLATIREFHQNVLHVELQIICAGRGNSLADLPELLSRTEEMAHYKAFWDDDIPEILFYDEIEDLTNLKDSGNFLGAEKRFINLLAIKDYEGAHQVLVEHLDSGISIRYETISH